MKRSSESSDLFARTRVPESPADLRSAALAAAKDAFEQPADEVEVEVERLAGRDCDRDRDRDRRDGATGIAWAAMIAGLLVANVYVSSLPIHDSTVSIPFAERQVTAPLSLPAGDVLLGSSLAAQARTERPQRSSPEILAELETLVGSLTGDRS